jgi:hypothetical protein
MIIRGRRMPVAMSRPSRFGVAKTIHLSGAAVMSAKGRELPVRDFLVSVRYVWLSRRPFLGWAIAETRVRRP